MGYSHFKVALLLERKILISFKIRYVIALNLQILELKQNKQKGP